jgi:hypothetical protein
MKRYDQANLQILFDLFSWKKRAGEMIRFKITENTGTWLIFFVSVDPRTGYEHTFASFTGETHEALYTWCLSTLTDFVIAFDNTSSFSPVHLQANSEVPTPALP